MNSASFDGFNNLKISIVCYGLCLNAPESFMGMEEQVLEGPSTLGVNS